MEILAQDRRRAFSHWLRTGFWPTVRTPDGIELKFNPYHDPRNGQFTFAPGGPRSLSDVIISYGRQGRPDELSRSTGQSQPTGPIVASNELLSLGAMNDANGQAARLQLATFPRNPRASRGNNSQRFYNPLTLAQTFRTQPRKRISRAGRRFRQGPQEARRGALCGADRACRAGKGAVRGRSARRQWQDRPGTRAALRDRDADSGGAFAAQGGAVEG